MGPSSNQQVHSHYTVGWQPAARQPPPKQTHLHPVRPAICLTSASQNNATSPPLCALLCRHLYAREGWGFANPLLGAPYFVSGPCGCILSVEMFRFAGAFGLEMESTRCEAGLPTSKGPTEQDVPSSAKTLLHRRLTSLLSSFEQPQQATKQNVICGRSSRTKWCTVLASEWAIVFHGKRGWSKAQRATL